MNWYPILEEYTKKLPHGIYVNKEAPSDEIKSELSEHSDTWHCCAVGSIMQKIVPSWIDEEHNALDAALNHIDTTNATSLEKDGVCFHTAIQTGDMADARRLFDKIAKQIKAMDQEDINNLVYDAINDYKDNEGYDDGQCDCVECTAEREEAEEE